MLEKPPGGLGLGPAMAGFGVDDLFDSRELEFGAGCVEELGEAGDLPFPAGNGGGADVGKKRGA